MLIMYKLRNDLKLINNVIRQTIMIHFSSVTLTILTYLLRTIDLVLLPYVSLSAITTSSTFISTVRLTMSALWQ